MSVSNLNHVLQSVSHLMYHFNKMFKPNLFKFRKSFLHAKPCFQQKVNTCDSIALKPTPTMRFNLGVRLFNILKASEQNYLRESRGKQNWFTL